MTNNPDLIDDCEKALLSIREATTYLSHPGKSELECAELNAREWFKIGWNAAKEHSRTEGTGK